MLSSLPLEILSNILSRLPAKSLGQCRCVCKSCRYLISDPEFVKLHLNRAISETNYLRLFTVHPLRSLGFESQYGFEYVDVNAEGVPVDPYFDPGTRPEIDVEIVGSCNGLICLFCSPNNFVLWNPTIKESRKIPESCYSSDDHVLLFYGFGYDPSIDDYRLVRGIRINSMGTNVVEVFSLKVDSWRRIEHGLDNISIDFYTKVGTFLNGTLHWTCIRSIGSNTSKVIVFLDLMGEKFEFWEILKPVLYGGPIHFLQLGVLGECLTLISDEDFRTLRIWEMKKYGERESWTSLTILPLEYFFYEEDVIPVCFGSNGELVLNIDGTSLVKYNLENHTSRSLKNCSYKDWFLCALYVESLVSPTSYYAINWQN